MSQQHRSAIQRRKETHNRDQVAWLLKQIENEQKLKVWGETSIADDAARKLYTRRRQDAINAYQVQLSKLVGERSAAKMVSAMIIHTSTRKQPPTRPL